ncbi:MAG: DUF2235 domain-containing protein [Nocardioidaceae bacterium]|nr:DUF2235 domain-containing protein [Nocardioidaceae bacterium]
MKRLVVCCDGTWNGARSPYVSNVAKIARSVETRELPPEVDQVVHYVGGVGTRYPVDRWLGGAFGFGLLANVVDGYQFLALNYEAGDEIFVFGFSRGAFTARSLGGMVGRIGLLRPDRLDRIDEAVTRYREQEDESLDTAFSREHCRTSVSIQFLGVFDTVGALGVPGPFKKRHQFHDIRLSSAVRTARQALAIDERRRVFEPCLWDRQTSAEEPDRVKQVWFEGDHSDVGGGAYRETGLCDTALLWMIVEAHRRGLLFDLDRVSGFLDTGSPATRHDPMRLGFRISNLLRRVWQGIARSAGGRRFRGDVRLLEQEQDAAVLTATSAWSHWQESDDYRAAAPNIDWWQQARGEVDPGALDHADALPSQPVRALLSARGVDLSQPASPGA